MNRCLLSSGTVLLFWLVLLMAWPVRAAEPLADVSHIRAQFDQELFDLAYIVFMANSNPQEAAAVAEKAVKARPRDPLWRTRAAQAAEWSGRSDRALQHWFVLAGHGDNSARQQALRLSRALQEYPLRKQLLEQQLVDSTAGLELYREYLQVAEGMGLPQDAYALLRTARFAKTDQVWRLSEQARLAELLGRPDEALASWEELSGVRPLTADEALKLAALYYGRGAADKSWQALAKGTATALSTATAYWRTYGDLAWARGERSAALLAARLLVASGTALPMDYQRLYEMSLESHPDQAYRYARQGWLRYRTLQFWYGMVEAGLRSGKASELIAAFRRSGAAEREVLASDARAWLEMARVYQQEGRGSDSLVAARVALRLAPREPAILEAYLWMLVNLRQVVELRRMLPELSQLLDELPELREPLAAALLLLGDIPAALRQYRQLASARQHDPAWLASYADLLEQAGSPEFAWRIRQQAAVLVQRAARHDIASSDAGGLRLLRARLMTFLVPGDPADTAVRVLMGRKQGREARELVLGWAMTTSRSDTARIWYWRHFARLTQRPEWARLGIALEDDDRTTMAALLEHSVDVLPYRDTIEAAQRTGQLSLARQRAFEMLQLNDTDHLLDIQLRQLYERHPGFLAVTGELHQRSGAEWFDAGITVSQPLSNRYSLQLAVVDREFKIMESQLAESEKQRDTAGILALTRIQNNSSLKLGAGFRQGALASLSLAVAEAEWQPMRDLRLGMGAEYNRFADETIPLMIAGTRDRLRLFGAAALDRRSQLSVELTAAAYHDQERRTLGRGIGAAADFRFQLTSAWPDYGLRLFGGYAGYTASGEPGSAALALVPQTAPLSAEFFMPRSYGYSGVGLLIGQAWRSGSYTRDWKPFAELDFGWSSSSGTGFNYGIGLVGPIVGLDQLLVELAQGSSVSGNGALTTTIGFRYRYFY